MYHTICTPSLHKTSLYVRFLSCLGIAVVTFLHILHILLPDTGSITSGQSTSGPRYLQTIPQYSVKRFKKGGGANRLDSHSPHRKTTTCFIGRTSVDAPLVPCPTTTTSTRKTRRYTKSYEPECGFRLARSVLKERRGNRPEQPNPQRASRSATF